MTHLRFHLLLLLLILLLKSNSLFAQNYYEQPPSCPPGSSPQETLVGEVPKELLPTVPHSQGETPTCGFHTGVTLLNALYKSQNSRNGEASPVDLSVLDAVMSYSDQCYDKHAESSLPIVTDIVPFLIKIHKDRKLSLNSDQVTLKEADEANQCARSLIESCNSGHCGILSSYEVHENCLVNLCRSHDAFRKFKIQSEDLQSIVDALNQKLPIQSLTAKSRQSKAEIPPYNIKSWDVFESKDRLDQQILKSFTRQNPILPLGATTCLQDDSTSERCDNGLHAVALRRIDAIECKTQDQKTVKTFHKVWLVNSWGEDLLSGNGPFHLEKMTEGIYKNRLGFVEIEPCSGNKKNNCEDAPLIHHSHSTQLQHYVMADDLKNVKLLLLSKKADPNTLGRDHMTALWMAAAQGKVEMVKELLKHREIDPNLPDFRKISPLLAAVEGRQLDTVIELLRHPKINPNQKSEIGMTPLFRALQLGRTDIAKRLLEHKRIRVNPVGRNETSLVHVAALKGQTRILEELIKKGALLDIQDERGMTPLAVAVEEGNLDEAKLLLIHGANPTSKNQKGESILDLARKLSPSETKRFEEWINRYLPLRVAPD